MEKWKQTHRQIIKDFLQYLNQKTSNYVLKGGSSLVECYGMNRFTEDIDFDSKDRNKIGEIVKSFCATRGYTYRVAKDTRDVQRYMIDYGDKSHPLKVETSFRRVLIPEEITEIKNGIKVYNIDELLTQKTTAYSQRDRIRDMHDVSFIVNEYGKDMNVQLKSFVANAIACKGLDQYDYLISTQELGDIDPDELLVDFMTACEKVGVFAEEGQGMELVQENDLLSYVEPEDEVIEDIEQEYDEITHER